MNLNRVNTWMGMVAISCSLLIVSGCSTNSQPHTTNGSTQGTSANHTQKTQTSGIQDMIRLPNGQHIQFVTNSSQGKWELKGKGKEPIATGDLHGTFKGDKTYQTTYVLDRWQANQTYVVLQLDETVHGFAQPVKLALFAVETTQAGQNPKPIVSGSQWGGKQFSWKLTGHAVQAKQQSLDKQGNTKTVFNRTIKITGSDL